ncbi:MarR family transcriptional regulator, partial [Halorubrum distributum]
MTEPSTREEKLELGVELLAHLEREELDLAAAV